MKKCSYADRYKATRKPACNGGVGCDACNEKWQKVQIEARPVSRLELHEECILELNKGIELLKDMYFTHEERLNEIANVQSEEIKYLRQKVKDLQVHVSRLLKKNEGTPAPKEVVEKINIGGEEYGPGELPCFVIVGEEPAFDGPGHTSNSYGQGAADIDRYPPVTSEESVSKEYLERTKKE